MNIPEFSVKRPVTVWMIFIGVVLFGVLAVKHIPVEFLPQTDPLKITIFISVRGGMSSQDIEEMVTKPIEETMSLVSNLEEITSESRKGRSIVTLKFKPQTNMKFAFLEVKERFGQIKGELPQEIEHPVIARYEEMDQYVMILALSSNVYSLEVLKELAEEQIKEELLRVEGAANVEVYGAGDKKILVEADNARLAKYNLSLENVLEKINSSNLSLVMGELENQKEKYSIRAEAEFLNIEDIKNVCLAAAPNNSVVRVKDIAQVKEGYLDKDTFSRFFSRGTNLKEVISIYIHKESQANTVEVCKRLREKVKNLQKKFNGACHGVKLSSTASSPEVNIEMVLDKSQPVLEAVNRIKSSLFLGMFLAAFILYSFLRDLRAAFMIVLAIPVCLLAVFSLMFLWKGVSFNIMSLSGLALGVGMVVDNAIVVADNIISKRKGFCRQTVIKSAEEVWPVILSSTITTIIVFLPVVFLMEGAKRFYGNLALVVVFSLIVSLFTAISLLPSLICHIKGKAGYPGRLKGIKRLYVNLLKKIFRRPKIFILFAAVFLVSSAAVFFTLDKEWLTDMENNKFTIFVRLQAGAKPFWTDKITAEVENVLKNTPQVKSFTSRAEGWSSRIYVELSPVCSDIPSVKRAIGDIRAQLKTIEEKYRGGFIYFSPVGKALQELKIDVYGHNYEDINLIIKGIIERVSMIEGLIDWKRSVENSEPQYEIIVDKNKSAAFSLSARAVAESLHAQIRGMRAAFYRDKGREIETVARLKNDDRDSFPKIKQLNVLSPLGERVYLNQFCDFKTSTVPSEIFRKNKNRYIEVSAVSTRHSLPWITDKAKTALKDYSLPAGYFWEFGGEYKKNIRDSRQLILALAFSLILVYMVLASFFESYTKPFIIMLAVPFAYAGVIWTLFILRIPLETGVIMGLIMLAGIVVNNSIIIVDKIDHFKKSRGMTQNTFIKAGISRLRPIFSTTLTTVLGLLPLTMEVTAFSLWKPFAVTVISGLVFSTILVLYVIPVIYFLAYGKYKNAKKGEILNLGE